jgi:hypothetical protein
MRFFIMTSNFFSSSGAGSAASGAAAAVLDPAAAAPLTAAIDRATADITRAAADDRAPADVRNATKAWLDAHMASRKAGEKYFIAYAKHIAADTHEAHDAADLALKEAYVRCFAYI